MRTQFSKLALAAALMLAITFTYSCSSDDGGGSYKTVKIGNQVWMAENLNIDVSGSKCYKNNSAYCDKYGRLYNWATAMGIDAKYNEEEWGGSDVKHQGICPSGWHIPSDDDWNVLMKTVNPSCSDNSGCADAGTKLKSKAGWSENGNGTDEIGFSALPGGYGYSDGNFISVGNGGLWWSASEDDNSDYAYYRSMFYLSEGVGYDDFDKDRLLSVRCLKD